MNRKVAFLALLCSLLPMAASAGYIMPVDEEDVIQDQPKETTVGLGINPLNPRQLTFRILHRPKFGLIGLNLSNPYFSQPIGSEKLRFQSYDFGVLAGYWSNKEKTSSLGWHLYVGIGFSYEKPLGSDLSFKSALSNNKQIGIGADYYWLRKYQGKYSLSVFLEGCSISRQIVSAEDHRTVNLNTSWLNGAALRSGMQVWF